MSDEHIKLTEHDEETGEPYDVCPSCSEDWPCIYARAEAAEAEVTRLRQALEWYAQDRHYCTRLGAPDWSQVDEDMGGRARAALGTPCAPREET